MVLHRLGLGANLIVNPALLTEDLSVTLDFVGCEIALTQMLRLTSAYVVSLVLLHFVLYYGTQLQALLMWLHTMELHTVGLHTVGLHTMF